MNWTLYIIRSEDNRLYTGITTNPQRRLTQHQQGKGAKFLRGIGSLSMVYQQVVGDHSTALKLEYHIKKLSKQKKELLILGQIPLSAINLS